MPLNETRTLYIMPGSKNYDFKLQEEAFLALLTKLKQQFDIILIDTPAGITPVHQTMLPWMKQCLLVTTLTETSLSDALTFEHILEQNNIRTRLVFNQVNRSLGSRKQFADLQDFGRQIYGQKVFALFQRLHKKSFYDVIADES